MSIIVYRDGVMASDTSSFRQGVVTYNNHKMIKGPNTGKLYGFAGLYSVASSFKDWIRDGEDGRFEDIAKQILSEKDEDIVCTTMIVNTDKSIDLWTPMGYERDVTSLGYEAIGGPYELAYGALYMGASAVDAVRACIFHSEYAKGEVKVIKL